MLWAEELALNEPRSINVHFVPLVSRSVFGRIEKHPAEQEPQDVDLDLRRLSLGRPAKDQIVKQ